MYPENVINFSSEKHAKTFVPYTAECENQLHFRTKVEDKPIDVATIIDPFEVKKHTKIQKVEEDGYKFYKIDKISIITYNSIKKLNTIFYKNHVEKPMFMTKIIHLIDKNPDNFKDWGCQFNCFNHPSYCKTIPVSRYAWYKPQN